MCRVSQCQGTITFVNFVGFLYYTFVSLLFWIVFSRDLFSFATIRSLGDVVAHTAGVISEPEFTEFELDPESDKFLVVATDGLWEFVTNEETVEIVEGQGGPAQAVDTLVTEAGTRWMAEEQVIDDTTVIVANLYGWRS